MKKNNYKIAASLISTSLLSVDKLIADLKRNKVDQIHFDVMDGSFVPRLGLYPELLKEIKSKTSIPVDVHMMIDNPENYIDIFAEAGADYIIPHIESTKHIHRTLTLIRKAGVRAGVALNPGTPLSSLDYLIEDLDLVMLMAINPGIVGHKFIPSMFKKISDLSEYRAGNNFLIEIDGGVNFENAKEIVNSGADIIVCGAQSIFNNQGTLSQNIKKLKTKIES